VPRRLPTDCQAGRERKMTSNPRIGKMVAGRVVVMRRLTPHMQTSKVVSPLSRRNIHTTPAMRYRIPTTSPRTEYELFIRLTSSGIAHEIGLKVEVARNDQVS